MFVVCHLLYINKRRNKCDLNNDYPRKFVNAMALLVKRVNVIVKFVRVPVRHKNHSGHWSVLRKKKTPKDKALQHFDDFYGEVYGKNWQNIRTALLEEENKYVAVVNNFSDSDKTMSTLESLGALNLKEIYDSQQKYLLENEVTEKQEKESSAKEAQSIVSEMQSSKIRSLYPEGYDVSSDILHQNEDDEKDVDRKEKSLNSIQLKSIETSLNEVQIDNSRIIMEGVDLSGLHEYVPVTKLQGLEDWMSESEYYSYYKDDFAVEIEKENSLSFPKYLNVYTLPYPENSRFPAPKIGSTGVKDYYLFDGASILPVLALDLQPRDYVLDMCAAPGGKGLSIIQTLLPSGIVLNDCSPSRIKRINNVLDQFMSDMGEWNKRLFVTREDARYIAEKDVYTKILVDVPCSTDRHNLHTEENNIFKPSRLKERLSLPQLQSEILANALKIITVGGTVVYSTCSLSPVENDGVVQVALKKAWEETKNVMVVKDMSEALKPLGYLYEFGDIGVKYGHIVVPNLANNWGPLYFCKIVRVQ